MQTEQIKHIKNFLEEWPSEQSLITPFVNNIRHGRFYDGDVDFPFCASSEERVFWRNEISRFSHLYIWAVLKKWDETAGILYVHERFGQFEHCHEIILIQEIHGFVESVSENIFSTPQSIIEKIGPSIDIYLWDRLKESPFTLKCLKHNAFVNNLYDKYCSLFSESLNTCDIETIVAEISLFINFCRSTDNIVERNCCIKNLLQKFKKHHYLIDEYEIVMNEILVKCDNGYSSIILDQFSTLINKFYTDDECRIFSFDGMTLGKTTFKDAEEIARNNMESWKLKCPDFQGIYPEENKIYFRGSIMFFSPEDKKFEHFYFRVYDQTTDFERKHVLDHMFSIALGENINSKFLSYRELVPKISKNGFFEIEAFHKSRFYYRSEWRKVHPSYVFEIVIEIFYTYVNNEEEAQDYKNCVRSIDIYRNNIIDQEVLFQKKTLLNYDDIGIDTSSNLDLNDNGWPIDGDWPWYNP